MDEFKQELFHKNEVYKKISLIKSKEHNLFTYGANKIAVISSRDDKRHILIDDISTLALGYWKLI